MAWGDIIFMDGLPYYLTADQIMEVLETFGTISYFFLAIDEETGNSSGYAFFFYQDKSVTDTACAVLNGIEVGGKTLRVRRAKHFFEQQKLQRVLQGFTPTVQPPTKVLCLTKIFSEEDLIDDDDYEYLLEDMEIECGKFGSLVSVVIPRPNPTGEPVAGVGKVFLEYADIESSTRARAGLNGRNHIEVSFYPENKFNKGEYGG